MVWNLSSTTDNSSNTEREHSMTASENRCLCCGEEMATIGICVGCVNADCNHEFDTACRRTGEVDPCEITDDNGITEVLKQIRQIKWKGCHVR